MPPILQCSCPPYQREKTWFSAHSICSLVRKDCLLCMWSHTQLHQGWPKPKSVTGRFRHLAFTSTNRLLLPEKCSMSFEFLWDHPTTLSSITDKCDMSPGLSRVLLLAPIASGSWASHINALWLSFSTCKMELIAHISRTEGWENLLF